MDFRPQGGTPSLVSTRERPPTDKPAGEPENYPVCG